MRIASGREVRVSTYHLRSPRESASFFAGLDLVEPVVVSTAAWRPDAGRAEEDTADVSVCGVAVGK